MQTLQKEGLIQRPSKTDRNAQNKELGDIHIAHTLLISHIRAVLTATCNINPGLELLFWREGRELLDTIELALPETYARVPVAPDGFFGLRDAKGRLYFFVEADRGNMTLKRFTLKLKAYAAFGVAGKHKERFGINKFRVLTVTSSKARCKNLIEAALAAEDVRELRTRFLFATEQDLPLSSPESIFTKIWTMPASEKPHSLLGHALSDNPHRKESVIPMQPQPNAHTEVRHGP